MSIQYCMEKPDLTRQDWIDAGMAALYQQGIKGVKADLIAKRLDITRGSFYWHFKNLDDFLLAMIAFWQQTQEGYLAKLKASKADARKRIQATLKHIRSKNSQHDVAMRLWAYQDDRAAQAVHALDEQRLVFVTSLFERAGYAQPEAQFRARVLYYFQLGDQLSRQQPNIAQRRLNFQQLNQLLLDEKVD